MAELKELHVTCPAPQNDPEHVQLAHGGGGRRTHELLENLILPSFSNHLLLERHDGATLTIDGAKLAFTTDSYVVKPLFFPGGDIGTLAINGTVNDLAMCGARPLYLSSALSWKKALPMEALRRVVESMRIAAASANVQLVTGDTKVVDKGKGDGIFVNTAGIGLVEHSLLISPGSVRPGDAILLSGDIGRHGIAIMATREGLSFETTIESDCATLWDPVAALLAADVEIHCLRDLTRGGLSSGLIEIAEAAGVRTASTKRWFPCAMMCWVRAKFWDSTPCILRTKDDSYCSCRRAKRSVQLLSCANSRSPAEPFQSAG